MKIPKTLSGPTRKLVVVGKKQRYYVDPKDAQAVREMKKQLMLYESKKKLIFTKAFRLLSHFISYEMLETRAPLIYQGRNTKFFDFNRKEVHTIFQSKELMEKNLKWMKKLTPFVNIPEILECDTKENRLVTRYREFELLPLRKFRVYVDEVVDIDSKLWGRPKKVKVSDFIRKLPRPKKELASQRIKKLGGEKSIHICGSHGDFHPGNLPRYGTRFYLLDFDSVGLRPKIFDFACFSFVPAHFNKGYFNEGKKLFRKFLDRVETTPTELVISLSTLRSTDSKLQELFEEEGFFLD